MYCILVTGIPAAGKSTLAGRLADALALPLLQKDAIKEILFDDLGFRSREEKVKLGVASMDIMYHMAGRLMALGQPFILENNFEDVSRPGPCRQRMLSGDGSAGAGLSAVIRAVCGGHHPEGHGSLYGEWSADCRGYDVLCRF